TGRTHQLRVHLSHIGSPIIGDRRYQGKRHHRLMLHAHTLRVDKPAFPKNIEWIANMEENWQWPG
ncbi:MAG: RluA family pseudouridine synthase, partial [Mariprofundaceae bacterium]|nr:RluA family pseudouridine synthase [Mariprofundaceae bacterium]